jgi:hypothetical protein
MQSVNGNKVWLYQWEARLKAEREHSKKSRGLLREGPDLKSA